MPGYVFRTQAIVVYHHSFQVVCNALGLAGQHRSLVHYTNALEVTVHIKAIAELPLELFVEVIGTCLTRNVLRQPFRLGHVFHHDGWGMSFAVRESGTCLFMLWLAMHHDRITVFSDLLSTVPDLFYKGASSLIFGGL